MRKKAPKKLKEVVFKRELPKIGKGKLLVENGNIQLIKPPGSYRFKAAIYDSQWGVIIKDMVEVTDDGNGLITIPIPSLEFCNQANIIMPDGSFTAVVELAAVKITLEDNKTVWKEVTRSERRDCVFTLNKEEAYLITRNLLDQRDMRRYSQKEKKAKEEGTSQLRLNKRNRAIVSRLDQMEQRIASSEAAIDAKMASSLQVIEKKCAEINALYHEVKGRLSTVASVAESTTANNIDEGILHQSADPETEVISVSRINGDQPRKLTINASVRNGSTGSHDEEGGEKDLVHVESNGGNLTLESNGHDKSLNGNGSQTLDKEQEIRRQQAARGAAAMKAYAELQANSENFNKSAARWLKIISMTVVSTIAACWLFVRYSL